MSRNPLTLEEALDALVCAIEQCQDYSPNDWVLPKQRNGEGFLNLEGFLITDMKNRIADTFKENDNEY